MEWSHVIVGLASTVFGGGALAAITTAYSRRHVVRAEAADKLAESAIELLNTVKADARADLAAMREQAAESRREAAEARREATELRLAIRAATREVEELASYLHRITLAIHDPSMTLERLRILVGSGPPNGTMRLPASD